MRYHPNKMSVKVKQAQRVQSRPKRLPLSSLKKQHISNFVILRRGWLGVTGTLMLVERLCIQLLLICTLIIEHHLDHDDDDDDDDDDESDDDEYDDDDDDSAPAYGFC